MQRDTAKCRGTTTVTTNSTGKATGCCTFHKSDYVAESRATAEGQVTGKPETERSADLMDARPVSGQLFHCLRTR